MRSVLSLSLLSTFGSLVAATPVASTLESRTCSFDEASPLTLAARDVSLARRALTATRPANLAPSLDQVWKHTTETRRNDSKFKNYGYDQVIAGKGKINFCVRWESTKTVTEAQRASIQTAIKRNYKKWIDVLAGYDGFPYSTVDVNVVGWAVADKSRLQGSTAGIDVYTTKDKDGIPECDSRCGRYYHQDGNYASCPGGAARHYDNSLWLTDGFGGGAGGDWGQRVATEYFLDQINAENIHIFLHELGHTFALDDFYDWTPAYGKKFLMKAGGAFEVTDFDAWMARDWWTKVIKARYANLAAPSISTSSKTVAPTSTTAAFDPPATTADPAPTDEPAPLPTEDPTPEPPAEPAPTGAPPPGVFPTGVFPTGVFPTGTGAYPAPTGTRPRKGRRPGRGPQWWRTRRTRPTAAAEPKVESFAAFGIEA